MKNVMIIRTINPFLRSPEGRFAGLLGLGLGLGLSLLAAPLASGQCLYEATFIQGPMCSDGSLAGLLPWAMNEQGDAAGWSICSPRDRATIWTGSGLAEALPDSGESRALAILDPDHVVGQVQPTGQNSVIASYWLNRQEIFLPLLPGANTGDASGINSSLQIVGLSNNDVVSGEFKGFLWQNGQTEALVLPFGTDARANDINEAGQITGWMGTATFIDSHAYIWENGNVTDLGVIPGGNTAEGKAINNLSHVVGSGVVPDGVTTHGQSHACYWNGQTMIDLGMLPGHARSNATDINDINQIVGRSVFAPTEIGAFSRAVLWQNGQIYDLNDLNVTDLGGGMLLRATAINNDGQILANAGIGVLLTPIGSAPGDIDNNCFVNVNDLLLLLGEWGETNSFADINGDGNVNVTDLLALLGSWG